MPEQTFSDWLNNKVTVPFVHSLDNRMKRIVVIASLFGFLYNKHERDKAIEFRLSKIMALTNNSNCLTLPLIYNSIIWNKVDQQNKGVLTNIKENCLNNLNLGVTNSKAKEYATAIVAITPSYLLYDVIENIIKDYIQLFESVPFIINSNKEIT